MRQYLLGLTAMALLAGNAIAQPAQPGGGWTRFTDPTENAFTLDVPQGWRVAGGVRRFAPSEAKTWVTAVSPDGGTEIFLGDPSIPLFDLPNPAMGLQEGGQAPGLHRPLTVMRYRPGAEFAALYGTRSLAGVCSNVQMQGTQARPDVEEELRAKVSASTRLDAGMASFECERGGQKFSAAVVAGTDLYDPTGAGGVWGVNVLFGFRTPQGGEAEALQVLGHMRESLALNPQWEAALKQAGDQETQELQRQNAARAQQPQFASPGLAPAARGAPPQRDIMTPFLIQHAAKEDQHQEFMCHIRNGGVLVRYWDPQFGRYRPRCN